MARLRLNQEYRNKISNRMRVHLEQEETQEKENFFQLREKMKPLQDKTWKLAEKIVSRHYTPEDIKMAYHLQNKFENVDTIAKDSCFHFGYLAQADDDQNDKDEDNYITKHFDFRLDGNINGQESGRQNDFAYAYFRDELKGKVSKGKNVILILTLNKNGVMVVEKKILQTLIGHKLTKQMKGNLV